MAPQNTSRDTLSEGSQRPSNDAVVRLQVEIAAAMHHENSSNSHKKFICYDDLKRILDWRALREFFHASKWNDNEINIIFEKYLRVLACLIYVNWPGISGERGGFRSSFLRVRDRDDSKLFFAIGELGDVLGGNERMFLQEQYAFKPAIIEEFDKVHIQRIGLNERLPFMQLNTPNHMGIGGFGEVTREMIAPNYLVNKQKGTAYTRARVVACKRYRNEKPKEDFEKEQKTLDYLKESLRGDTRILVHIASIVHGNEFMILLPLAAHGDLEIFLRRGRQPQADTSLFTDIYNFNHTFPRLTEDTLHESLLEQLLGLSSALVYLHEELRILGLTNRYCAHMDLKPENILIDVHDESSVGKWMISDFGISLFDKRTNQTEATISSVRDVGRRLTSRAPRAQVIRGHGSYQPPEVDDTDVDARKCDVWSFGAILCDVLVFSFESNRVLSLEQFRGQRSHGGDDFFYMTQGNTTILKPSIRSWLDANYNHPPVAWMRDCVTMLRNVFITNPTLRCGIREVSHGLERLLNPPQYASPTTQLLPAIQETSSIEHPRSNGRMIGGHLSVPKADRPNAHMNLPRDQTISQQYSPPLNAAPHRLADLAPLRQHQSPPMQQHEWPTPVESPTQLQLPFRAPFEQSVAESQSLSYGFTWPAQLENIPKHTRSRDSGQGSISSSSVHSGPSIEGSIRRDSSLTPKDFTHFMPRPKISLGLPSSPQALAISPSGDFVAFLFAQNVLTVPIGHDDRRQISLTTNVKWKKLCIAEPYTAVYGVKNNGQKCVELHHMTADYQGSLVASQHENFVSDVIMSSKTMVSVYGRSLRLHVLGSELQNTHLEVDNGHGINQAAINVYGQWLCVWALGSSGSPNDCAYFWDIGSARLFGKGEYKKDRTASTDFRIWAFSSVPAFICQEKHGDAFVVGSFFDGVVRSRECVNIGFIIAGCVVRDSVFVCLKKKSNPWTKAQLWFYNLSIGVGSTPARIGKVGTKIGDVDGHINESSRMTFIEKDIGNATILICTDVGEVIRYHCQIKT